MVSLYQPQEYDLVMTYLKKNIAYNYFLLLGMLTGDKFKEIYMFRDEDQLKGLLFLRHSGTLQLYYDQEEPEELMRVLRRISFKRIIGPGKFILPISKQLGVEAKEQAYLAYCRHLSKPSLKPYPPLREENIEQVTDLLSRCFTSYPNKDLVKSRLLERGRGIGLWQDSRLVAMVHSEFETREAALIVSVATAPDFRGQGYASKLVHQLAYELIKEGRTLYLQFDDPAAGSIYQRLGFEIFEKTYVISVVQ